MADTVHGKKEIVLNKCSKQDLILISLLVIVALILKVVGNLFQTFYLDGSMWLRYWMILCAQPKNHLLSFTDWLPAKIELVIAYSSGSKFHWEVVLSDNPADDDILLRYTVWCVPLWLAVQNVHLTDFWESFSTSMETDKYNNSLHVTAQYNICRPSDRVRKKTENYAEIFGNIMRKKVTIMRKRRQIMRKFLQFNKVASMAFSNVQNTC